MVLKAPVRQFELGPVQLIILFALLQLSVCLLTDGFALSFDESVWHYIGRNWFRHGLAPYTGGTDNKSPFIFAIYGLSDKLFGVNYWFPRVLGTACQSVCLFYVYKIARHFAGKQAGIMALQVYGLSLLWQVTKGRFPSLTETYEVTCLLISVYIWLTAEKAGKLFGGGMLAALGCAFRLTAFLPIFAIFLFSLRRRRMPGFMYCLGVLAGCIVLIGLMQLVGIRPADFFFYGFGDNFGAGTMTDHPLARKLEHFSDIFLNSDMVLLYPGVIAYLFIEKKIDLLAGWAIAVFAGICAIGMFDGGHLKDILPVMALMNGIAIARCIQKYRLPAKKIVWILWIVFIPKLTEPATSFKSLLTGFKKTNETSAAAPDTHSTKMLGRWIRSATTPEDKVFVAGYGAQVQVYSERISPTIYFDNDALKTPIEKARFKQDLGSAEPTLIAVPLFYEYKRDVDEDIRNFIDSLTEKDYSLDRSLYGYSIYRRRATMPSNTSFR